MNKTQLKKFKTLLEEKRDEIIKKAKQTLDEDMTLDQDDLPDEMDLASSEYLQSFTFRLRGREKTFLDKINKALVKIEEGGFGVCEECEEEISVKRLEARPETNLCIRCKEDQERMEKDFGLERALRADGAGPCPQRTTRPATESSRRHREKSRAPALS